MEILLLHKKGLSQRHIARKLGISRNTVKKYLANPEFPEQRKQKPKRKSLLDRFHEHMVAWLEEDMDYTAIWIYDHLCRIGFTSSYEIVKRKVRALKEERRRVAYMRFETEPGYQAQVDFGEFQVEGADGTIRKLYLFSMILGYSRRIYAELIEQCDLPTFLDCHIRAFSYFGGLPEEILYDRMKNVFIGKVAGKNKFNETFMGFALHYGFRPVVSPAYAAWVKGKIERPYAFIREGFWRGYGFTYLEVANRDLLSWLAAKEERIHGTTHERVSVRFEREGPYLGPLPRQAFDTSYRVYRNVYKDCTVRFEGNSYVVPHKFVGKKVILRVKEGVIRIFSDDLLVVTYEAAEGKGHLVQDKRFYAALLADQELARRKYGGVRRRKGRAKGTISPVKPRYDMDVEVRPLQIYDRLIGEVRP